MLCFPPCLECEYGDVKLEDGKPFIFAQGQFHPICGHGFWDKKYGINIFCKTLGFKSGSVLAKRLKAAVDLMRVGGCLGTDTNLTTCSGDTCSDMELGGACNSHPGVKCTAGTWSTMKVKCEGAKGTYTSCGKGLFLRILKNEWNKFQPDW